MIEKLLAGSTLAICLLLVVRLLIGDARRRRFDLAMRRGFEACRRRLDAAVHWRSAHKASAQAAEDAIRRARGGKWDGNVYRPRSFRRPRKPH